MCELYRQFRNSSNIHIVRETRNNDSQPPNLTHSLDLHQELCDNEKTTHVTDRGNSSSLKIGLEYFNENLKHNSKKYSIHRYQRNQRLRLRNNTEVLHKNSEALRRSVEEPNKRISFASPNKSSLLGSHIYPARKIKPFISNFSVSELKQSARNSSERKVFSKNSRGRTGSQENILSQEIDMNREAKFHISKDLNYTCISGRGKVDIIDQRDMELLAKSNYDSTNKSGIKEALTKL